MKYGTSDFDNIVEEISNEVERINNEVDIYKFSDSENVKTYNSLTTILLMLRDVK